MQRHAVQYRDIVVFQDRFHNIFIHGSRGCHDVASNERYIIMPQKSLQRTVFHVSAVYDRKRYVYIINRRISEFFLRILNKIQFSVITNKKETCALFQ